MSMRAILIASIVALVALPAAAQTPKPRPPIDVEQTIENLRQQIQGINNKLAAVPAAVSLGSPNSGGTTTCDFNLFNGLKPETLINQLKTCATDTFVEDTSEALASATAGNDKVGMGCLAPGLAILKAAQAAFNPPPPAAQTTTTPAPTPAPATGATPPTTPDVTPAPAPPPTFKIRLILLFQKWREFGNAGGPSACKSWVQTTITNNNPLLQ